MDKRVWAVYIKQGLIGLAVIFGAGVAWDRYFNAPYARIGPWAGLIAVAVFYGAAFAITIINAVASGIYLWMFSGKDYQNLILGDLRNVDLPPPDEYAPKNFEYLAYVAEDRDANPEDRVKAATLLGVYKTLMGQGIFKGLALHQGFDEAMLRYAAEAPKRRS